MLFEFAVIVSDRFLGFYFAIGDRAKHVDESEWVFGIFNPSTKQSDPCPMLAGFG
jgi:hypothetical protein